VLPKVIEPLTSDRERDSRKHEIQNRYDHYVQIVSMQWRASEMECWNVEGLAFYTQLFHHSMLPISKRTKWVEFPAACCVGFRACRSPSFPQALSLDFPRDGEVLEPSGIQGICGQDPRPFDWPLRVVVSGVEPR
jgi:hypothetical protein